MSADKDLYAYALRHAQDCIVDRAHESRGDLIDEWDLSPSEADEVIRLAQSAKVTIPASNQDDEITSETASHVLFDYRAGGHPAGGFVTSILDAFSKADPDNDARLAAAFPGHAAAVRLARAGQYHQLREIAGSA